MLGREKINKDTINLKKLQDNVSKLDKIQQFEIYKIVKDYDNKLTENKNGIFINLSNLNEECISKIENFVNYSLDNQQRLQNLDILTKKIFNDSFLNTDNLNSIKEKKVEENFYPTKEKYMDQIVINIEHENKEEIPSNLENEYLAYPEETDETDKLQNILKIKEEISLKDDSHDLKKKYKFTGKRARIWKKCKEINKYINLKGIGNYNESKYNDNDNNDNLTSNIKELTEDKI